MQKLNAKMILPVLALPLVLAGCGGKGNNASTVNIINGNSNQVVQTIKNAQVQTKDGKTQVSYKENNGTEHQLLLGANDRVDILSTSDKK